MKPFLLSLFLSTAPLAAMAAEGQGCCSSHGGIASCEYETGLLLCKDGEASPSCECQIELKTKTSGASASDEEIEALWQNGAVRDGDASDGSADDGQTNIPEESDQD